MKRSRRLSRSSGQSLPAIALAAAWPLLSCWPCAAQTAAPAQRAQDVAVRGSVSRPGRLTLPAGTTARAALRAAGGLRPDADADHIVIRHLGKMGATPSEYALDSAADPALRDGDTIVVPALAPSSAFTLSGPGIRNPAEYALLTPTVSLAAALGRAGGLEDKAEIDKVHITRTGPGGRVTVIVLNAAGPDVQAAFQVRPGDDISIGRGKPKRRVELPLRARWPDVP